jgi:geranylgeranyl pyrophosphate synthase
LNLDQFIESSRGDLEQKIADMITDKKIASILEGGKRLRPLLAYLSFKACTQGKEKSYQYQKALEGAVVIELAHAASLVHDDIIDNDRERRGKPSFYIKEGINNAILTGHKMLLAGFNITLKHGKEVAKLYLESWNEIVNGELDEVTFNKKDIKNLKKTGTKSEIFKAYEKIINLKTAALFSSACKAGAIEANMSGDVIKLFASYGREIGLAYQLADDLVDLVKGEIIDSVVVPLLNRLENKGAKIKALKKENIKKELEKNKDKIQEVYVTEIKKHIKKAEELSNSDIIPSSQYKGLLTDAPTYIINKMLKEINIAI